MEERKMYNIIFAMHKYLDLVSKNDIKFYEIHNSLLDTIDMTNRLDDMLNKKNHLVLFEKDEKIIIAMEDYLDIKIDSWECEFDNNTDMNDMPIDEWNREVKNEGFETLKKILVHPEIIIIKGSYRELEDFIKRFYVDAYPQSKIDDIYLRL